MTDIDKKRSFIVNSVYYAIIGIMILLVCKYLLPAILPFIIAFIIVSILQIPVRKIYGMLFKGKRIISIVCTVIFFGFLFLLLGVGVTKIVGAFTVFIGEVPKLYSDKLVPVINYLTALVEEKLTFSDPELTAKIDMIVKQTVNSLGEKISDFSMNAVKLFSNGIFSIPGAIIKIIVTIVASFFLMLDYDRIIAFLNAMIPKSKEEKVNKIKGYVKNTLIVYVKSYTLLFCITLTELILGFLILGIPYAPFIGLLVAIFDILPIVGTGGILIPWALILLIMGNIPKGLGMVLLYIVITAVRNTAEPKLVGTQIGLHPLATLVAMYTGLMTVGIVGMLVFPVTLAVLVSMKNDTEVNK